MLSSFLLGVDADILLQSIREKNRHIFSSQYLSTKGYFHCLPFVAMTIQLFSAPASSCSPPPCYSPNSILSCSLVSLRCLEHPSPPSQPLMGKCKNILFKMFYFQSFWSCRDTHRQGPEFYCLAKINY